MLISYRRVRTGFDKPDEKEMQDLLATVSAFPTTIVRQLARRRTLGSGPLTLSALELVRGTPRLLRPSRRA